MVERAPQRSEVRGSSGVRLPSIVSVLGSAPGDIFTLPSRRTPLRDAQQGTAAAFTNKDRPTEEHALPIDMLAPSDILGRARQTACTASKPERALRTGVPNAREAREASTASLLHPYPYIDWSLLKDAPSSPPPFERTAAQCQSFAASGNVGRQFCVRFAPGSSDAHAVLSSLRCHSDDLKVVCREAALPSTSRPPPRPGQMTSRLAAVPRFLPSSPRGHRVGDSSVEPDGRVLHEHHELFAIGSTSGGNRNLRQSRSTNGGGRSQVAPSTRSDAVLSGRCLSGQPAFSLHAHTFRGQPSTPQARQDANDAWRPSKRSGGPTLKTKRAGEPSSCLACGCVATAEWRSGPAGPRTLCNACGLHYAKKARLEKPNVPSKVGVLTDVFETLRRDRKKRWLRQQSRRWA
ncbi:hypothetical protein BDZ90DRAFT_126662 [Jaminaea rosea]|uniref:GATA-type domain-containing protein n=1 Tax=Jaminaea rosea TaxID=1569628 RepID=A0A316UJ08_9BASI|nr:hypothetical protein BDZ90DRAFT_126662 [Jaminaea rosea]PWN24321.1 hypothetical protein BDZ90DRAFT_126662 [Jaminaea rosea]